MTVIVGLNAYHADSAASLVVDGRLVAAAEEERFRRIKHWAGFPGLALGYCLKHAGLQLSDVDVVAVNSDPRANLPRKLLHVARHRPSLGLLADRLRNAGKRASLADELERALPGQRFVGSIERVEHHLAHLTSAFHVSPFASASVVSIDGFGDFASAAWGHGENQRIDVQGQVRFPHSLGIFYQALTQYLGFKNYGDEYKVMGLAPYGEPRFGAELSRVLQLQGDGTFRLGLEYFRHHRESVPYSWSGGEPTVGDLYSPALEALLGPARAPGAALEQRHKDLARSVQAAYEEAFFHLLRQLHARQRDPRLAVAGGCGNNSVANGKVTRQTPFRRIYVQSAAGDAGGAIGAALHTATRLGPVPARGQMPHAYWGPEFSDAELRACLEAAEAELAAANCRLRRLDDAALFAEVADAIARGSVVGWFQGRMEWGPRALGNRSILGDPRRADMKDILNLKIKRRESFRPFAPSILREEVDAWFEQDDDVPFMMQVYQIREPQRGRVPAITHVDGSGRLQTVERHTNPRYHALIRAFAERSGVPMVLNTSFNENEPVVCRPEEALACFLRTKMDLLALGNHVVTRLGAD
jgi:carbamoyltransferase